MPAIRLCPQNFGTWCLSSISEFACCVMQVEGHLGRGRVVWVDHRSCLFACRFGFLRKSALLQAPSSAVWPLSSATEAPAPAATTAAEGEEGPLSQQEQLPWTPMRSMAGLQPRALGLKRDRDPSPGGEPFAEACILCYIIDWRNRASKRTLARSASRLLTRDDALIRSS